VSVETKAERAFGSPSVITPEFIATLSGEERYKTVTQYALEMAAYAAETGNYEIVDLEKDDY
jgi:hypothetical protein